MGKGAREITVYEGVVHVNSVEEDERLRTILDFDLFPTLKKPPTVHSLLSEPLGLHVFESEFLDVLKVIGADIVFRACGLQNCE